MGIELEFPRDHLSHPQEKTEWWHHVGNLIADDGSRYGYQYTVFRHKMSQVEILFANAAITDIGKQKYLQAENATRYPGIIGSKALQLSVGEWNLLLDGVHLINVDSWQFGMKLQAVPATEPVQHRGVKPHYSITRLNTSGELFIDSREIHVVGTSWMDHEFFTGALDSAVQGWDWFGLQLFGGIDLMVYRMRGDLERTSCTLSGCDSIAYPDDVFLQVEEMNGKYPSVWSVNIPSEGLNIIVEPKMKDQEFRSQIANLNYWEGAVSVSGTEAGEGYMELTGYDKPFRIGD